MCWARLKTVSKVENSWAGAASSGDVPTTVSGSVASIMELYADQVGMQTLYNTGTLVLFTCIGISEFGASSVGTSSPSFVPLSCSRPTILMANNQVVKLRKTRAP